VDTLQIKGQAVTFPRGVSSSGSTGYAGWSTILSLTMYEATGAPLIVSFSAYANGINTDVRLLVGGGQVFYADDIVPRYMVGFSSIDSSPIYSSGGMVPLTHYVASPPTGTVSVAVQMRCSGSGAANGRSLTVLEAKR